jgi:hypothetical protein
MDGLLSPRPSPPDEERGNAYDIWQFANHF